MCGAGSCSPRAVVIVAGGGKETAAGDPLVLTLGQQAPPPLDDRTSAGLLSPGAGFLLSPGSLLFSLATMQAIQELISS